MARKTRKAWSAPAVTSPAPKTVENETSSAEEFTLEDGTKLSILWRHGRSPKGLDETQITLRSQNQNKNLRLLHHTGPNALRQVFSLEFPPNSTRLARTISLRVTYQEHANDVATIQAGPYSVEMKPSDGTLLRVKNENEHSRIPTPPINPLDGEIGTLAAICQAVLLRPRSFF